MTGWRTRRCCALWGRLCHVPPGGGRAGNRISEAARLIFPSTDSDMSLIEKLPLSTRVWMAAQIPSYHRGTLWAMTLRERLGITAEGQIRIHGVSSSLEMWGEIFLLLKSQCGQPILVCLGLPWFHTKSATFWGAPGTLGQVVPLEPGVTNPPLDYLSIIRHSRPRSENETNPRD